ncbi:hypothetical protein HC823_00465 [Candidatus Gracilibacteria bacterium]|nr:hypothetical protein [Candidatus Gracilibacteria bacterium]
MKLLIQLFTILNSQDFLEATKSGYTSYTMVKPVAHTGIRSESSLIEKVQANNVAELLFNDVEEKSGGQVLGQLNTHMDISDYEKFYGSNFEEHSKINIPNPKNPSEKKSIWNINKDLMLSGSITPGIFYHPKGKAPNHLKKSIGATNPNKGREAGEKSVRAEHADSIDHTLIHCTNVPPQTKETLRERIKNAEIELNWLKNKIFSLIMHR